MVNSTTRPPWPACRGFTLVELLVVIAIISILAGLLLPSLQEAIEQARIASCASQQHQVYLALSLYSDDNEMLLPPIVRRAYQHAYSDYNSDIGRFVFSGLGYLPAQGYAEAPGVLLCPGQFNRDDLIQNPDRFLTRQGEARLAMLEPKADGSAPGYCWGSFPLWNGENRRRLDRPNTITHALYLCDIAWPNIDYGTHENEAANISYEDGHTSTSRGVATYREEAFLANPVVCEDMKEKASMPRAPLFYWGIQNPWVWAREEDEQ